MTDFSGYQKVYIVGAHSRSQTLGTYLTSLYPQLEVAAYLVNNEEPNPEEIAGVPVYHFEEASQMAFQQLGLDKTLPVFLGTRGVFHEALSRELRGLGFETIIPNTVALDMEMRERFLVNYYAEKGIPFEKIRGEGAWAKKDGSTERNDSAKNDSSAEKVGSIGESKDAVIYMIRSAFDKALEKSFVPAVYEMELQVGAALTKQRLTSLKLDGSLILTDDTGVNISARNRQFCELTGLYWIWQNAKLQDEDFVGIEHYRRHFLLPSNWSQQMLEKGIDVILPVPLYVGPSLEENYISRHEKRVLELAYVILENQDKQELNQIKSFMQKPLYSPCNMLITRKHILDDLCAWLFPILLEIQEQIGVLEDSYQNRYPGFLSERLISYYFESRRDQYHVVYADKDFWQ